MDCISMFVHIMKENDSRVTLSKERLNLNSDRQQFHEYLQNEQIIEHTHTHRTTTSYGVGDTGPGLGQVQTANNGIYQLFGK